MFLYFFDSRQPQEGEKQRWADLRIPHVEKIQKNYTLMEFGRDPVARAARQSELQHSGAGACCALCSDCPTSPTQVLPCAA